MFYARAMSAFRPLREAAPAFSCVIGLTGSIASGKSNAREFLESCGAAVIDADKLGHLAYKKGTPCFDAVVAEFSGDVVGADGEIDRRRLGTMVFSSPERMQSLNTIVWPAIEELATLRLRELAEIRKGSAFPKSVVRPGSIIHLTFPPSFLVE
jgi:dephospho-CoA kinase